MRLIDADRFEAFDSIVQKECHPESYMEGMAAVLEAIDNAPTIEPKQGEWNCKVFTHINKIGDEIVDTNYYCSECGEYTLIPTRFCGNCGAKMQSAVSNPDNAKYTCEKGDK